MSTNVNPVVCFGLTYEIYSTLCGLLPMHAIEVLVLSLHTFTLLLMILDSELSLLPNVFPYLVAVLMVVKHHHVAKVTDHVDLHPVVRKTLDIPNRHFQGN